MYCGQDGGGVPEGTYGLDANSGPDDDYPKTPKPRVEVGLGKFECMCFNVGGHVI